MTKQKITQSNIVIVGAGLIGTSCALSLRNLDLSIHLLENHLPDILSSSQKNSRPISLAYGSYRLLNAMGVWHELSNDACPILSVHVSEQGRLGITHFCAKEQKVPALGYVVPFAKLQSALYHRAASQSNIHFHSIQSIEKIDCGAHGARVHVHTNDSEHTFHADLLIAADGTNSTCRDLLTISCDDHINGDIACIYQLTLADDHDHTAYERFTELGVLAVLPLLDKKSVQLVWTLTPRVAKKINDWDDTQALSFFQTMFEGRLTIAAIKKIAQFPLQTRMAKTQIVESAVLLGNAAHTIYPVAAQGFNLGLHDIAVLYDILFEAKKNQARLGNLSVLKKYEHAAKSHQANIFRITNHLVSLFEYPFIGNFRGMGLLAIDVLQPLKSKLAKRTMGVAEKLSRLLRDNHA